MPPTLDEIDEALIAQLQDNVRCASSDLASALSVSAPTVKRRLQRLLDNGQLAMGPVVDLYAAGFEFIMVIGLKAEGRAPLSIAKDIAALPQALTVNVVLGRYDVEVVAAVKTRTEVSALITSVLPSIEGVAHIAPSLALDIWKFQLDCRGVAAKEPAQKKQSLDALDMQIIECLQTDVRLSNRRIAATLDVSESNIRVRIRRMLEQKQLRLTTTHAAPGYTSKAAFVGISVSGGHSDVVCKALALLPEVSFVCTALGRYEIICCVNIFELEDLAAVVHEKIAAIPHVRDSEPLHCLQQVKHQVLLGLIL